MERLTRLTAASAPKRFVRFSTAMRMTRAGGLQLFLLQFFRDRLDLLAELRVDLLVAALSLVVVVDVGHFDVEIRADAAGELDRHLRLGTRLALDAEFRRDREYAPFHRHTLPAFREHELDEGARRLGALGAGEDADRLGRDPRGLRSHELDL